MHIPWRRGNELNIKMGTLSFKSQAENRSMIPWYRESPVVKNEYTLGGEIHSLVEKTNM